MAVLKVKNNVTKSLVDVRVDDNILPEISKYHYIIDKYSKKPYREVISGSSKKKYFLDREIFGCDRGDGNIVSHKNGDPLDCRLHNLYNRRNNVTVNINSISSAGFHWPSNVKSFLNFIEKRSDTPEGDLCSSFLAIADIKKYNKNRIDIVTTPETYEFYKKKEIYPTLRKVLNKYFDWDGTLNITKDATSLLKAEKIEEKIEGNTPKIDSAAIFDTNEEAVGKMSPLEKLLGAPVAKNVEIKPMPASQEIEYEFYDEYPVNSAIKNTATDLTKIRRELYGLSFKEPSSIVELLKDNKIFPTEVMIKILRERGAATVQF
jgi:hypothetical protein